MAVAWTQVLFRIRQDDGSQLTATWMAANNVNCRELEDTVFRIRFDISETGTTAGTLTGQLQCNKNAGAFQAVTASSTIAKAVAGRNSVDSVATTQIIGSGTFVAGNIDAADGLCAITASIAQNSHTELEFCVQLNSADLVRGDVVQFRVVVSPSTAFGTYTATPSVTVQGKEENPAVWQQYQSPPQNNWRVLSDRARIPQADVTDFVIDSKSETQPGVPPPDRRFWTPCLEAPQRGWANLGTLKNNVVQADATNFVMDSKVKLGPGIPPPDRACWGLRVDWPERHWANLRVLKNAVAQADATDYAMDARILAPPLPVLRAKSLSQAIGYKRAYPTTTLAYALLGISAAPTVPPQWSPQTEQPISNWYKQRYGTLGPQVPGFFADTGLTLFPQARGSSRTHILTIKRAIPGPQAFSPFVTAAAEVVTLDKWWVRTSERLLGPKDTRATYQTSWPDMSEAAVITADQWHPGFERQLPRIKNLVFAYPYWMTGTQPVAAPILPDRWQPGINEPRRSPKDWRWTYPYWCLDTVQPAAPTSFDKWAAPANQPQMRGRIQTWTYPYGWPDVFQQARIVSPDMWQPLGNQPQTAPRLQTWTYPHSVIDVRQLAQPERIMPDKWQPRTEERLYGPRHLEHVFPTWWSSTQPVPERIFPDRWQPRTEQRLYGPKHLEHVFPTWWASTLPARERILPDKWQPRTEERLYGPRHLEYAFPVYWSGIVLPPAITGTPGCVSASLQSVNDAAASLHAASVAGSDSGVGSGTLSRGSGAVAGSHSGVGSVKVTLRRCKH